MIPNLVPAKLKAGADKRRRGAERRQREGAVVATSCWVRSAIASWLL